MQQLIVSINNFPEKTKICLNSNATYLILGMLQ